MHKQPGFASFLLLPLAVGVVTLLLTGWLSWREQQSLDARLKANFEFGVRQTVGRITQRVSTYEQLLRGTRGLFDASTEVTELDFQRYVVALKEGAEFAGIQAMAFTRKQGEQAFITFVAPNDKQNRLAFQQDQLANPPRRLAMEQTRDDGEIAITTRVNLLVDSQGYAPAAVLYLAVYNPDSDGEIFDRQQQLRGWVQLAFRLRDLMASLSGEATPGLAISIYDGVLTSPDKLMFESHPDRDTRLVPRFSTVEYIGFPQHHWTVQLSTLPTFEERYGDSSVRILAISGVFGSVLLAVLTWQLVTSRARADERALAMTQELREREERMRHMAQHDALTQLPNRALFSDRLRGALARARREQQLAGVLFVDLDRFKAVNDTHGHATGDRLLIAATTRMRECLRESDTLARLGGDEFVVLLPHIDQRADAERVANRICNALAHPFIIDGHYLSISASVGIGLFPEHGSDEVSLMKSADDAMYRAKEGGRNSVVLAG